MAINLIVNGVAFEYPETGDADWGYEATDWATAVSNSTLQKTAGLFTITADVDFGASYGVISKYFTTRAAAPADAGELRLGSADTIEWRNAGDTANNTLGTSSNALQYNGITLVDVSSTQTLTNKTINGATPTEVSYLSGVTSGIQAQFDAITSGGALQLTDLSDVNTSTPTNRNVLVADGVDWESRALVEADISDLQAYLTAETNDLSSVVTWAIVPDAYISESSVTQHEAALTITESQISDLGTYLENVVEDTTPVLGGNLDVKNYKIVSTTGDVVIEADDGLAADGSDINLTAGDGAVGSGGAINLTGGYATGVGAFVGGDINLTGGNANIQSSGDAGSIVLTPGHTTGSGSEGSVQLHAPVGQTGEGAIEVWKDTNTAHTTGNKVTVAAPSTLASDTTFTLPDDNGTLGYVLKTDGSGNTSWGAVALGTIQLSDLTDVNTSTPTNRNVLVADGVDWESRALVKADISDADWITSTGVTYENLNTNGDVGTGSSQVAAGDHTHQLSDLTDVNTSTPTNRNVLVADGVDWESRALVKADISDADWLTDITSETLGSLSDVVLTGGSPAHTTGDVLLYNGTNWVHDPSFSKSLRFFNGATADTASVTVTSNGTVISANVGRSGSPNQNFKVWLGATLLNFEATSTTLTAGTDTTPQMNYVYIYNNAGTATLTSSTTGWPTTFDFAPIATVYCQSAASLQTYGAYKMHAWTDHVASDPSGSDHGHLGHLNAWIRTQHATWLSGVGPTLTIDTGVTPNTVYFSSTAGEAMQLHEHDYPAMDMGGSPADELYLVNHDTTPYTVVTDFASITADRNGDSASGVTLNYVIWGVVNEASGDCKLMCNLPNGTYPSNKDQNAIDDTDGTAIYAIPAEFRGVGFLIARITLKNSGLSTYTNLQTEDLRGLTPNTAAGAAGGGGGITDHGLLSGLTDDDHTQYLLVDGTRAMTGALNMGSQNITTVGTVDGVDVSAHKTSYDNHLGGSPITYDHSAIDTHIAGINSHNNWMSCDGDTNFSTGANGSGSSSIAIGSGADSTGSDTIALGSNTTAGTGTGGIAIGSSCSATQGGSIAIGLSSTANYVGSIVIGNSQVAADTYEIHIGTANGNKIKQTDTGVLTLSGTNAQFVHPNYATASLPVGTEGGTVYDTDENTLKVYGGSPIGWVKVAGNLENLVDLGDVGSPVEYTNRYVLVADGTKYVSRAITKDDINGGIAVADLTDTNVSGSPALATGNVLTYYGSPAEWRHEDLTYANISDLNDTAITGASKGELLVHNGTNWVDLSVGNDDYILVADSAQAAGVKWSAVAGAVSELSDLSDVHTSTPTNRNVLVADGVDFESRALVMADISDSTWISEVVDDTTPQLGGMLDVNGNAIGDGNRELITFTEDASAVNHVNIENEATGSGPIISAAGDDTNVDLNIQGKGTGKVVITDIEAPQEFDTQTGTTFSSFTLAHADQMVTMNNASANTVTLPANSSVAYPVGTKIHIMQLGAGATTVAITTDTLNVNANLTKVLNGQYAVATCLKVTSTSWVIFGNLVAA